MADHSSMKLGRKAIVTDTRTLRLATYLTDALPEPPVAQDWTRGLTDWGTMLNEQLGCCTIAGVGHAIQVWTVNNGSLTTVPDSVIEQYYEKWDGYVAGDETTDNGGIEIDVLKAWKKQGFNGNRLLAFADPCTANIREVRQAITLFGGVYIGLDLPVTAQKQEVWDVVRDGGPDAARGSWGGHCVFVPKYDANTFTCITWGQLKTMTVPFWQSYCDEAHALLDESWTGTRKAPSGFDRTQLLADLKHIH